MKRWDYSEIIQKANDGDPHMMVELAKLFKAGAFGETDYFEYIYWLKSFFENPKVKAVVNYLEAKYSNDNDYKIESDYPPLEEEAIIREDIIYAGISLGLYYYGSSRKDDLVLSLNSFVAALDASSWDYLECANASGKKEAITDLLTKTRNRMKKFGYWEDSDE